MSAQDRATTSELAAEFERAIGSLAGSPIANADAECIIAAIDKQLGYASSYVLKNDVAPSGARMNELIGERLTRIAAIALEGAARLRRQQ